VVWLFLSRGMKGRGLWALTADHYEAHIAEQRRANALLERIAGALEKRSEKIGGHPPGSVRPRDGSRFDPLVALRHCARFSPAALTAI
jgi:hypothetical protein